MIEGDIIPKFIKSEEVRVQFTDFNNCLIMYPAWFAVPTNDKARRRTRKGITAGGKQRLLVSAGMK